MLGESGLRCVQLLRLAAPSSYYCASLDHGGKLYTHQMAACIAFLEGKGSRSAKVLIESDFIRCYIWKLFEMCVIVHKVIDAHRRRQEF